MTAVVDSDRSDEWGAPLRHALVYHAPSRTVSCFCTQMPASTADDAAQAREKWTAHVRNDHPFIKPRQGMAGSGQACSGVARRGRASHGKAWGGGARR